jgi:hypothetical protein
MKILDLSAGNRAVWFDKEYRDTVFVDRRAEVGPDFVADSRELPSKVGNGFDLIVFDPPHMCCGPNGHMAERYGYIRTGEIKELIRLTAREAHRVSNPDALMAFKFNDHDISFRKALGLMSEWWEPLFGHLTAMRTAHSSATQWIMLRRRGKPALLEMEHESLQSGPTKAEMKATIKSLRGVFKPAVPLDNTEQLVML